MSRRDLADGGRALEVKVKHYRPGVLAILGVTAYRAAFSRPEATLGLQLETIGESLIWVLPNPSGLNAHYTPKRLATLFRALRQAATRQ